MRYVLHNKITTKSNKIYAKQFAVFSWQYEKFLPKNSIKF